LLLPSAPERHFDGDLKAFILPFACSGCLGSDANN
jgi:hypothetical protein